MAEGTDPDGAGSEQTGHAPTVLNKASVSKQVEVEATVLARNSGHTPPGRDGPVETESSKGPGASRTALQDQDPINGTPTTGLATAARTRKRKPLNDGAGSDRSEGTLSRGSVKKIKLAEVPTKSSLATDKSLLSPEVWHHIFTFCPPKSLGNLLSVNKLFNVYLDPASSVNREVPISVTRLALSPLEANAIWQASRRLFWPQMPSPFRSNTELDMWRLACSSRCQDCGKLDIRVRSVPPDSRHPGPGSEGVASIWAFGTRMCARCLLKNSVKEVDLLLSPSIPSAVVPALPFVFLTQELDVFSATTLEQSQLPPDLQVTKRFLSSDVEALKQEFLHVKDMGQGTVSEWLKGLDGRGIDMRHDASKWEKWELSGGTAKMSSQLYPGYVRKSPVLMAQEPSTDASAAPLPNPPNLAVSRHSSSQGRHERTAEEVAELKAARKAEIERRALLLDPPLTADVLGHIPSFQAATHIVAPLDDYAWDLLKPRLLGQRADAEKAREGERMAETKLEQERLQQRHLETTLATTKEARDRVDRDWEEVQAPVRAKIAGHADEFIRDWCKDKKVTRENCSAFAVNALLHVRKRFYTEVEEEVTAAVAAGKAPPVDPRDGPFTQKLTLENMKWIFDTKIKPHTESFRKELFYCNGCEGNFKPFGFEGVIQHYAAKHTGALSSGNIVVHWRAEWPEHPPFNKEARPAKPSYPHGPNGFPANGGPPHQTNFTYPPLGAVPALQSGYQPNVGYGYGAPTYGDYYPPPPLPPPPPAQPFPVQPAAPHFVPQPGYEPPPAYATPPGPYPPFQGSAVPYLAPVVDPGQGYAPPHAGQYDYHHGRYHTNTGVPHGPPQPPPAYPNLYQTKLEDIARNSREVWRLLGDIPNLPGSVRVFVTIHHLAQRFRSRFYETPPLSMFIDGLSNNKDMRPVRNVNELVCKTCHLGLGNAASVEADRKDFSLPQLANHFQTKHVEPTQRIQTPNVVAPVDWVVDMVLLRDPDVSAASKIASLVSEPQSSLLAAALPFVPKPQSMPATRPYYPEQQGAQPIPVSAAGYTPLPPPNGSAASRTTGGYAGDPGSIDKFSAATESASGGFPADYRNSGQSSTSATPAAMSENGQLAHNEGGRQSSQSSRPPRGQKGFQNHKKTAGKNKHGKDQGKGSPADRVSRKKHKADDKRGQRGGPDVRAMRAPNQLETPPVQSYSARPERPMTGGTARSQASIQSSSQLGTDSHQIHPVSPRSEGQGSSLIKALESQLEQRRSPQSGGQQQPSSAAPYMDSRVSDVGPDVEYVPMTYTQSRHGEKRGVARSPTRGSRYEATLPANRDRNIHHPTDGPGGRVGDGHRTQRAQAGFVEPLPRYAEEGRFGRPVPPAEDRGHEAALSEAEYRRYHEGVRIHSRPPIEAYEIVQVIDESGEYFIRRPVRHESHLLYLYPEERSTRRDSGSYAASGPVYVPGSRRSAVREEVRTSMAPESWPGDRRADPAYYEEYDPRFPAA